MAKVSNTNNEQFFIFSGIYLQCYLDHKRKSTEISIIGRFKKNNTIIYQKIRTSARQKVLSVTRATAQTHRSSLINHRLHRETTHRYTL